MEKQNEIKKLTSKKAMEEIYKKYVEEIEKEEKEYWRFKIKKQYLINKLKSRRNSY